MGERVRGDSFCHECDDGYTHLREYGKTGDGRFLFRCENGHVARWESDFRPTWLFDAPLEAMMCHDEGCDCEFCIERNLEIQGEE